MSRSGDREMQFKLFEDYKNYVARFPEIARRGHRRAAISPNAIERCTNVHP